MFRTMIALLLLSLNCFAQFEASISSPRIRKIAETPWTAIPAVEWAANPPSIEVGMARLTRPACILMRTEMRYALSFENRTSQPVQSYVTGSGVNLGFGGASSQVCSNLCGGPLAASDGIPYVCPVQHPDTCMDVGAGLDHHVLVVNASAERWFGSWSSGQFVPFCFAAGDYPLSANVYTTTQEVNGLATNGPSHNWNSYFPYFEVKITVYAQ